MLPAYQLAKPLVWLVRTFFTIGKSLQAQLTDLEYPLWHTTHHQLKPSVNVAWHPHLGLLTPHYYDSINSSINTSNSDFHDETIQQIALIFACCSQKTMASIKTLYMLLETLQAKK